MTNLRIPADADLPEEKLTRYLLVPKERNDKSKFLAQAGFTQENPDDLRNAIFQLVASENAVEDSSNEYGVFYQVQGNLIGVNGRELAVITVWIRWYTDNSFHFVTLKPYKEPRS